MPRDLDAGGRRPGIAQHPPHAAVAFVVHGQRDTSVLAEPRRVVARSRESEGSGRTRQPGIEAQEQEKHGVERQDGQP